MLKEESSLLEMMRLRVVAAFMICGYSVIGLTKPKVIKYK